MEVKISSGNSKLGKIPSVSLPAGITCRNDCECSKKCYAKKLERLRRTVKEDAVECAGNCTECAITDGGCWSLQNGEQVVFNEH